MTIKEQVRHEYASYISALTAARLGPGGPHHVALSDLLAVVVGDAMRDADLDPEVLISQGADRFYVTDDLEAQIVSLIADHCFQAALRQPNAAGLLVEA